jgi:tripartite-type tricarboxylate transporter receptor subunit TctC
VCSSDLLGVKGYEAATFTGLFAPAGVPASTLNKLNSALRKALAVPAVRERYQAMGVELMDMPQAQFEAYVRSDFQKWQKVARDGNIAVD